jgi:hypothetical protein
VEEFNAGRSQMETIQSQIEEIDKNLQKNEEEADQVLTEDKNLKRTETNLTQKIATKMSGDTDLSTLNDQQQQRLSQRVKEQLISKNLKDDQLINDTYQRTKDKFMRNPVRESLDL